MKLRHVIAYAAMVLAVAGAGADIATGAAHAAPGNCTNENPYPTSAWNICVTGQGGPGVECARFRCAYPPGTPGKWDVNGVYKPKMG